MIDDGAAMPVASDKACPREDRQMGRHGILRNLKKPGDFACGDPIRFSARQKAKGLQPSRLSERGEACNGLR